MVRLRHRAIIVAAVAIGALTLMAPAEAAVRAGPRIALVESAGATGQRGLGRDLRAGFIRAASDLGFRPSLFIVGPGQDPLSEIGRVVDRRFDLIVLALATPSLPQIVAEAAAAFPHARMLVPELETSALAQPAPNVEGYVFRVEQPSYLAGYLAASMGGPASGRHDISAVGGVPLPVVKRFLAGYAAGARAEDPKITVLTDYSYDFAATPKCRSLALQQIATGSRAVFDVAGACGEGALRAAIQRGAWGIGVDFDHASLGPRILTSVLKREGVALAHELRAFSQGRLSTGRTDFLGLREGAVGLGKLSPAVPAGLRLTLGRLRAAIAAGRLRVAAS
jgi:basic membrane protein A